MWNNYNKWAADKIATQQGLNTTTQNAVASQLDAARQDSMNKIQGYLGAARGNTVMGGEVANATGLTAQAQSEAAHGAAADADQKYQAAQAAVAANNFAGQTQAAQATATNQLNRVASTYQGMNLNINKSANSLDQEIAKAKSQFGTDRTNFMETQRKADRQYGLDQKAAEFLNGNKAATTAIAKTNATTAQGNARTRAQAAQWAHADRQAATAQRAATAAANRAAKSGTTADKAAAATAKTRAADLKSALPIIKKSLPPTFATDDPNTQGNALKGIAQQIHAGYPRMTAADAYKLILAIYGTRAAKGNYAGVLQQIWST